MNAQRNTSALFLLYTWIHSLQSDREMSEAQLSETDTKMETLHSETFANQSERRSEAEALMGLETETSRPRPHSCKLLLQLFASV